ncbi:MAG TPA: acetyl-CoA carboxylase biotin carboxyl carrier protein [Dissulfurispiraceae bacterium]|nr:acetyl-CoA carboxylase biotin carboxyl carrier protein [Dissulfurispiraceae bacterium]
MELDEIKGLMELLKETDVTEIQIEKEGIKLKIRRGAYALSSVPTAHLPATPAGAAPVVAEPVCPVHHATIASPIVGTFYRAASPESSAFVEVGSKVKKGQVLCIIEAMKLMNEIESDVEGVVAKILVDNGSPVEYGQPLFLIEPA